MSKLALIASEDAAYGKLERSVATHAMLGWADAAYYRGIPAASEQLLLRVGSDASSGFEWGDAASIFFVIAQTALANVDFTKTYCLMDE